MWSFSSSLSKYFYSKSGWSGFKITFKSMLYSYVISFFVSFLDLSLFWTSRSFSKFAKSVILINLIIHFRLTYHHKFWKVCLQGLSLQINNYISFSHLHNSYQFTLIYQARMYSHAALELNLSIQITNWFLLIYVKLHPTSIVAFMLISS